MVVNGQVHHLAPVPPRNPGTLWRVGWIVPSLGLLGDEEEKSSPQPGIEPRFSSL